MIHQFRLVACLVNAFVALGGTGCQLKRPETIPTRMIEPRLVEPQGAVADSPNAAAVRLLETQARGHIGRHLLHQLAGGEFSEDPVWLWTSSPDRYLDSALHLAIASSPDIRLLETSATPALGLTLLAWHLDSNPSPQLVGVVELQLSGSDREVRTEVIRASEPVTPDLPGNLADAAGRLLARLAADGLTRVSRSRATLTRSP